jgi:beta-glucanase (GH16 family)
LVSQLTIMRFLIIAFSLLPFLAQAQCYELVWSDEFNTGNQPDPTYWTYDLGTGNSGWGNNEIQVYTNNTENVRIEDGHLIIQALRQNGNNWTSSRVKSQGRFNFTYGRIEFRAKLPAGSGTWPALWMLGENITEIGWPACGEIDVMEHVGKAPGRVHASLHTSSSFGATVNTRTRNVSDFSSAFHLYEAEWTPDAIIFSIDGQPFYTYNPASKTPSTWPFNSPQFIIMNVAMGGNFGSDPQYEVGGQRNGVDPNLMSATMEVDYVRVYQNIANPRISGPDLVSPDETGLGYTIAPAVEGTYTWTVPEGAAITSGQGTPTIEVTWGTEPGDISVTVAGNCDTYQRVFNVATQAVPTGDVFVLDAFSDGTPGGWSAAAGSGNTINLTEQDDQMRIDYDISNPAANPNAILRFDQAVDVSATSELQLRIRTFNESGTVSLRADPFDRSGTSKNASPVFRLEPIRDDGEWAWYTFDFSGNWKSNNGGLVDSTELQGIRLYVNYGFFGRPGADSLWIDQIQMVKPGFTTSVRPVLAKDPGFSLFPNPANGPFFLRKQNPGEGGVVRVYGTLGQLVSEQPWPAGQRTLELNTTQWPTGSYRLVWQTKQKLGVRTLVVPQK